jgi:hypothetical protein
LLLFIYFWERGVGADNSLDKCNIALVSSQPYPLVVLVNVSRQLLIKVLPYYALMQALLHFIYWDSLPDMQELTGLNTKWASTLMAQHLLAAADRYCLERLRVLCEATLCDSVAINTVATTLALAEQHHCFQLKAVCLKFIALPENLRGEFCGLTLEAY